MMWRLKLLTLFGMLLGQLRHEESFAFLHFNGFWMLNVFSPPSRSTYF